MKFIIDGETVETTSLQQFKSELMTNAEFSASYREAEEDEIRMIQSLKQARLAQRLSQADIAQRSGLKAQNISRLERGLTSPTLETLSKYARALGGSFVLQLN